MVVQVLDTHTINSLPGPALEEEKSLTCASLEELRYVIQSFGEGLTEHEGRDLVLLLDAPRFYRPCIRAYSHHPSTQPTPGFPG